MHIMRRKAQQKSKDGKTDPCSCCFYTKLDFLSIILLTAPSPKENIAPPARQSTTFISVELRGVIMPTIIKRSIPPPSDAHIESQAFDLAHTLMQEEMEKAVKLKVALVAETQVGNSWYDCH